MKDKKFLFWNLDILFLFLETCGHIIARSQHNQFKEENA